jgi:peptidyl-prolyl cis-trans isomerase B (cyclophilin B)
MITGTGCATVSFTNVEQDFKQSAIYPPIILTSNTEMSLKTLASTANTLSYINMGVGMDDVDPHILTDGIRNVISKRFQQAGNKRDDNLTMIFDARIKRGSVSGSTTSLELTGIFKDGDRIVETVTGKGASTIPYPAVNFGFRKAAEAAFAEFDRNLQSAPGLAAYVEPGNSTLVPSQTAVSSTTLANAAANSMNQYSKNETAVVTTSDGTMKFVLWPDVAPNTVNNFIKLASQGFYDGTCFHRILKGFIIQGGDPLTKDLSSENRWGTGGPGYTIKAEFNDRPHVFGVLSMARSSDPDSGASQFFICDGDAPFLNHQYTAFGKLVAGEDVLQRIANTPVGPNPTTGETSKPLERISVISIRIASNSTEQYAAIPANAIPTPNTPDQAQELLEEQPNSDAHGIYELDGEYTFNVLDSVYFDSRSNELSLVGHFDKRFQGSSIPYLQHLATLLKSPKPEFSLTWTPDSEQRVNTLLNWHATEAEGDRIADQWGKIVDEQGNITETGLLLLPAMGIAIEKGRNTTSTDILKSLYLANGDQHAVAVLNAVGIMLQIRKQNPGSPEAAMEGRKFVTHALNLDDDINADSRAVDNGTLSVLNAFIDIDTKICQGFDETFHFQGTPIKDAFVRSYQQMGGDPANAMQVAFNENAHQLATKLEDMLNPIFTRPEGLQIPPELVEEQFHVHPEMIPQYLGIPRDSLLAKVMFDGDYLCKRLENRPDLKQRIPGYQTAFEFEIKHPQFRHTTGNYRTWISVDKMDTPQSADEKTLAFRDVKMRFNIREQEAGATSFNPIDQPQKPGDYEELITFLWDNFEQEYPALHELRESAKLAAAAKWILQHNPSASLPEEGLTHWQGPTTVPGLVFMELSPDPVQGITKTERTVIAEGGVSLTPFPQSGVNNPNLNNQSVADPFPYDASVVDLSGLGGSPVETLTPALFTHEEQDSLASQIFRKKIIVPEPHPVGWVKEFHKGQEIYNSVSVALNQVNGMTPVDAEQAIQLRLRLEHIRQVAIQLAQTERAINILDEKNADQVNEFEKLQKEIAEDRDDFYEHMFAFAEDQTLNARKFLKDHKDLVEAGKLVSDFNEDVDYFEDLKASVKSGSAPLASLEAGVAYVKRFSEDLQKLSGSLNAQNTGRFFKGVSQAKKLEDIIWIEADFAKVNFITDVKVQDLETSNAAARAALKDKLLPLQKQQSDELDALCNDPQIRALTTPATQDVKPN